MASEAGAHPLRALHREFLVALALVGLVYVVGDRIPVPGLAPEFAATAGDATGNASLWSVLALGFEPILSALLLLEMVKLLVPRFARWTAEPGGSVLHPRTAIAAFALSFAAYQANGVYQTLVMVDALGRDTLSAPLVVATLVAGVATLLFLAERASVPGLALGGVWLVASIPWMETIVFAFVDLNEQAGIGPMEGVEIALLPGLVVAAVAAVVFSSATLRERVAAAGSDPVRWSPLLVWPPVLAASLANTAAGLAEALLSPDANPFSPRFVVVRAACFGVILPVILFLYVQSIEQLSPKAAAWRGRHAVLSLIAVVQIAVCVGFQLLSVVSPAHYPIEGSALIVVVVVFSADYLPGRPTRARRRRRAPD